MYTYQLDFDGNDGEGDVYQLDKIGSEIIRCGPNVNIQTYIVLINFFDCLIQMYITKTKISASLLEFINRDVATAIFVKIGESCDQIVLSLHLI